MTADKPYLEERLAVLPISCKIKKDCTTQRSAWRAIVSLNMRLIRLVIFWMPIRATVTALNKLN